MPLHARAGSDAPPALRMEGGGTLPLTSVAHRAHLLGGIALYDVALYTKERSVDLAGLADASAPKALRITVTYEERLDRRAAVGWRRELVPALEPGAAEHLWRAFASLRSGDVVLVEYVPGRGTTVRVDTAIVVSAASHDVMAAFLDHWVGQRPLSEDIKRALLGRP